MFHAYCKNSIDHAKLADKVSKSMAKTLKPSLKSRCKFDGYKGSGHYYYFINAIRVMSFAELDNVANPNNGIYENLYSGEYRRDYVYDDEEYNKDIFVNSSFWLNFLFAIGQETDLYKKSIFKNVLNDAARYKYDGVYVSHFGKAVVNGKETIVEMVEAGLKAGDIITIDNRDCFLIKYSDNYGYYFMAIAID